MSNLTIDQFYETQFGQNWQHLVQQGEGRIHDMVRQETVKGKRKLLNFIGKSKARLITTRNGKTIPSNTPMAKRKLALRPYDEVYLEDEWDKDLLGDISSPRSSVVESHSMAFKRLFDETVIQASIGTAYIGEDGEIPVDLPDTQKVPVNYTHGNPQGSGNPTGLTLAKIIRAKSILGKNEVYGQSKSKNGEKLVWICSQQQLDDLLINVDEVANSRYADVKALVSGEVNHFMGFEFIRTELCPHDTATDIRTNIAMVTSGVAFSKNGLATKFSVRDDLNESLQVRTKARCGAVRTEEEKVVAIYCDESPVTT